MASFHTTLQFSKCAIFFRDMVNWAKTCIPNFQFVFDILSFFFSPMTVLLNLTLNISYKEKRSQKIRQKKLLSKKVGSTRNTIWLEIDLTKKLLTLPQNCACTNSRLLTYCKKGSILSTNSLQFLIVLQKSFLGKSASVFWPTK